MKIYLLWYQLYRGDRALITCATREYDAAEKKAIQLEHELTILNGCPKPYRMGIVRTMVNRIVVDALQEMNNWVIYKQGHWFLDNQEVLDDITEESNFTQ
jgi:hypothetical protein